MSREVTGEWVSSPSLLHPIQGWADRAQERLNLKWPQHHVGLLEPLSASSWQVEFDMKQSRYPVTEEHNLKVGDLCIHFNNSPFPSGAVTTSPGEGLPATFACIMCPEAFSIMFTSLFLPNEITEGQI